MEVSGKLHAPNRFTSKETADSSHRIGGWVGPRKSRSGQYGIEKNLFPLSGIKLRSSKLANFLLMNEWMNECIWGGP
jgi:hypothetical protein